MNAPSRTRNPFVAAVIAGALIATVALVSYFRPSSAPSEPEGAHLLASPAPVEPFAVTTLDGQTLTSQSWAGKLVVVNFWATWCAPCVREMPALSALQDRLAGDVVVVGLLQDTVTPEQARAFVGKLRVGYPIGLSSLEIERSFPPVERLPMTYVIDRSGRLVAMYLGELDLTMFERNLRTLLARV